MLFHTTGTDELINSETTIDLYSYLPIYAAGEKDTDIPRLRVMTPRELSLMLLHYNHLSRAFSPDNVGDSTLVSVIYISVSIYIDL
jgi:hypothetical protein